MVGKTVKECKHGSVYSSNAILLGCSDFENACKGRTRRVEVNQSEQVE